MEQKQSIGELLGLVRRNLITLIVVVGLGTAFSVAYALSRPSIYETSAKVLIESQQIPDETGAIHSQPIERRRGCK